MRSPSTLAAAVGAGAFLVGLVGYVALGWRFGGDSNTLSTALALVAVALAVLFTVRDRF